MTQSIRLRLGDCIERMKEMGDGSIGAVITDPPYFLGFMGKDFDKQGGAHLDPHLMQERHRKWLTEAFRVLVPGGVAKVFGGTRTFHRLAQAMEAVGFVLEPGKSLEAWAYGSGFPKSLNVSRGLDKMAGIDTTAPDWEPTTPEAKLWSGYGTALKPAFEPFLVGRKPE